MNQSFKFPGGLIIVGACVLAAGSAHAAIDVTFDAADSNISAGIYAFDLTGVMTPPPPTFESVFDFTDLANPAAGGVHNTQNPVGVISNPTGWNMYQTTLSEVQWYFENTSGGVDGTFKIQASPNLSGTLDWQLSVSGISQDNGSGTVTIVPEPMEYGFVGGAAALGLVVFSGWRRSRSESRFA